MNKLQEQKTALVKYFEEGCKPDDKMHLGLEVEHFVTGIEGTPVTFEEVQSLMRVMQQPKDESVMIDGLYMGYYNDQYSISLEPACQLEISIMPCTGIAEMMKIYESFYRQLCITLAEREMRAYAIGFHPLKKAEELPLIPKKRYQLMDEYFKKSGGHGIHMMRATASTQISIDYFSEKDFVRKFRAACLITPLIALLTDNAPVYQGKPNRCYSTRTHIWSDVDPDRCGTPPILMDSNFGFATYAEYVLKKPAIVTRHGGESADAGGKTVTQAYGNVLTKSDIEQILSMYFFDVRLKNYIEIRPADSMPPRYIIAYAQLIRTIFSSPAALSGIERHYAGMSVLDIEAAKLAICCNGYDAQVYGRPVQEELAWLLAQAKSRMLPHEERCQLEPLIALVANKKTIWEIEHYV